MKFVWYGPPGDAKVNHRFVPTMRGGRAVLVKSRTYRNAVESMAKAFEHHRGGIFGHVMVSVQIFVWRRHRSGAAEGLAYLDVDACCKAILDALGDAGVYEDDSQVKGLQIVKQLAEAKHMERIEVEVSPVPKPQRSARDIDEHAPFSGETGDSEGPSCCGVWRYKRPLCVDPATEAADV